MSGQARLALCAWVATLASACALLPLVGPVGWLAQAALLLGIQTAVGAAARRRPLPGGAVVGIQALVTLLLLTLVFVRREALFGVVPGPDAFEAFGALLTQGTADVSRFSIPAPVTDGIRLMLVGGVVVIGLLVDALAVTYRSAAPAGLPLLALYSVAAGLAPREGVRWLWFLCAASGYLLLLLAEGRDRLSQWGRVFGGRGGGRDGTDRPAGIGAEPGGWRADDSAVAPLRTGRRIGAVALGVALVAPAALPSLSGGLLETARGGRGPGGGTVSAVNPLVALENSLQQPENRTVLTYRTDAESTSDMYLRIVALDEFDGAAWRPSERRITELPQFLPPVPGLSGDVRTDEVTTIVRAADWYAQSWLPMPYPADEVRIGGRWRFEPEGRTVVGDRGQTTRGARYQVTSLVVQPTARQLAEAPEPSAALRAEYTEVPGSLPPVVAETARRVTRGAPNDYAAAVMLQDWFAARGGFRYSTEVEAGTGSQAIARFLEDREGFCVHFAFSMAAMARTLDIPARVAVGFTPGQPDGEGGMTVGLQDAHAWPELYFEGVGWTRFEPTPSRGNVPEYTRPDLPPVDRPSVPAPLPEDEAEPLPLPSRSAECPVDVRAQGACDPAAPAGDDGSSGGSLADSLLRLGTPVLTAAGLLALLAGLVALPGLWRRRVRSRRMGGGPDPGTRTLAAWRETVDSAWDHGILPQESATPRMTAARIVRLGRLEGEAAEAAHRLATAVERALYAPEPRSAEGLAEEVRRVRDGLREAAGRRARLRARLLPRSAVRMVWAVSDRWSAVAERYGGALRRTVARLRPSRQRA
ncbi:transglutaminase [Streptomyces carminius]|uniref:Transglutaminase n=1 Tax=Streptomyces carminius TaxID=2665496 RepID=A0A2M8M2V4_9ACTN|nr:DUF3488 and transglutaminase-like domain-containing protein [Streptomyces carminius]PJE98533.1 transglutaminase [Streptomyces carminius]